MTGTKVCIRCGDCKPIRLFTRRYDRTNEVGPRCIKCERARNKARRATPEAREKLREWERTHRKLHLELELQKERARGKRRRANPSQYGIILDSLYRNREWLEDQKLSPCMDCGASFSPCAIRTQARKASPRKAA